MMLVMESVPFDKNYAGHTGLKIPATAARHHARRFRSSPINDPPFLETQNGGLWLLNI